MLDSKLTELEAFLREHVDDDDADTVKATIAEIEWLRAALKPFASGEEWGAVLAWITQGAPTKAQGIATCKQIVAWQCAADEALAHEQSEKP